MGAYSFDTLPTLRMSRRKFDMSHMVKTTMRVGKLTPINCEEVLPGDGWYTTLRYQARLSTAFLHPVMDTFFMDTFHFFVPLRLLYTDFEEVFGNPSPSAYQNNSLGAFPAFSGSITVPEGTVGDYLGLPPGGALPSGISVLKFRAFALIYERWFRNENTVEPMHISLGEVQNSESPNTKDWSPNNYTGKLPDIGKLNDYFTSCLPSTQKGTAVSMGSVTLPSRDVPVLTGNHHGWGNSVLEFSRISGALMTDRTVYPLGIGSTSDSDGGLIGNIDYPQQSNQSVVQLAPSNLWARQPSETIQMFNVNDLRFAVQMQKMLEKDARGGSRYNEYISVHYGVSVTDARAQIPEYLGGLRQPLNIQQVAQTSESTSGNPLATLGAYSQSQGRSRYSKSFTEHGFIMTLAAIRYKHSYQQGIDRSFMRTVREDFYDPLFANLGEQPVYKWQLYAFGSSRLSLKDGAVFGYQEYAADYRYRPDIITGQMRSSSQYHFEDWHFADNYANAPSLNEQFTNEKADYFRRTTYVTADSGVDDFLCEFYFDSKCLRSMPLRSTPGLLDHH